MLLTGTADDELLLGGSSDDTLNSGAGDDTMVGGDGLDTYIYNAGDGFDRIEDRGSLDDDVLQISGFTVNFNDPDPGDNDPLTNPFVSAGSQVTFSRANGGTEPIFGGNDVTFWLDDGAGTIGAITVLDTLTLSDAGSISFVEIVDSGITLDMADIRSDIIRQQETSGGDVVFGFDTADIIVGGTGDDTLTGRDGADTYVFSTGDGSDFVSDHGVGDDDRIVFTDRALADFTISYGPGGDGTIILEAGSDRIEIFDAVSGSDASSIAFYDFTDQTLSEAQMRQALVDQALTLGADLIGADGAQIMSSSVGSDRFVSGREGSDFYTFVVGDGADTFFDGGTGSGDVDVLDLTAFSSTFFTVAGSGALLLDQAFSDNAVLRAGANRLSLIDLNDFELVQFSDVSFDNNADDTDGNLNFADFVANNGIQTKLLVSGTNGNDNLVSLSNSPVDEHFELGDGSNDQVLFNVSEIGDDSIFKPVSTVGGYDLTIDFTGIVADTIFEQSVTFSISALDPNDLIITIVHEDSSLTEPETGIGRTEETITINDGLAQFSAVDTINIVRDSGTEIIATTAQLRQLILDQQVTAGDDVIFGYTGSEVLSGGAGEDTLFGGHGSDRYEFSAGDENVVVSEANSSSLIDVDIVAIHGFAIDDATLSRSVLDANDLIIDFGADVLTIKNFFRGGVGTEIEQVHFEAETASPDVYTVAELTVAYFEDIRTIGADMIVGGAQIDDTLDGGAGDDTLDGVSGSDRYIVRQGEGNEFIRETGDGGTDVIQFDVASTQVTFVQDLLDPENFHIVMNDGTNIEIYNFLGNTSVGIESYQFTDLTLSDEEARIRAFADVATSGDDQILGSDGADSISGAGGNDTLNGNSGDDRVFGGSGTDLVRGGEDNDVLRGGSEDDLMAGNSGADVLAGNGGNDVLFGGSGDDRLFGGQGRDMLTGRGGADIFAFSSATHSRHGSERDAIKDFTHSVDKIDLSNIMTGLSFIGTGSYTGSVGEVRYNHNIGRLYIDTDGDSASEFSVDISGAPTIDSGDLIL